MENFRQQFLLESVETLETVSQNLRNAKGISEAFKREIFRNLHTIKGTAQTFGFSSSSHLAHELENLLAGGEVTDTLFQEGIELLIKSLTKSEFEVPNAFKEKIGFTIFQNTPTVSDFNTLSSIIPAQFTAQLSSQEKTVLYTALQNGKNLFCLEIGFDLNNFADELINFREVLNASGEIIATLPSAKFYADGKIGFQILFASRKKSPEIEEIAAAKRAEIIFNFLQDNYPNDVRGVLAQVVKHGEETAKKLGKQVDFKVPADEINISAHELKIIFDALLHLVRNAVDHAIETTGKIEIRLQTEENGLRLIVSDNGRGFDLEKIKAKAVDKNLLSPDDKLTERETIDLIFLPEFSTKTNVTDISGRGVGLDAVKYAVEKAGGKITTESRNGKGTTFEIFLPR
jgi:chemotaxis protein histidine kinase CheA